MLTKKRNLLQPKYISEFRCIGSVCEDCCCIGWRVQIDKKTYSRYRKCSNQELRVQMGDKVTRQRTDVKETNYAKIKLNADGLCPFLGSDKLCDIQRNLGEEYLSDTCTTYPRISNIVNDTVEKSLTLSCPEAARLALLKSNIMEFYEDKEEVSIRTIKNKVINTGNMIFAHKPERYFWELRIFIISLLQNRSYALWKRVVILGLFCRSLEQVCKEAKVHHIPQLIGTYLNNLDQGLYKDELDAIPKELMIQIQLMKEVADERFFTGVNSQRFIECFKEFLHGIQFTVDSTREEIAQRYANSYDTYYRPLMEDNEYILENYLVNYVFKNLFPFSGEKHVLDNYVMLVVHFAIIKMLLIGLSGFHKENFSTDHVLKLIQSFSKTVEHNKAYLTYVFELLKANNFNTLPYMAILIKN